MLTVSNVLIAIISVPLLYAVARIIFAAYFRAKMDYQRRLFQHLQQED